MNKEPNPEKIKPLRDKCNSCGTVYKLTDSTAFGINYPKKPECRHLMCRCPKCEFVTIIFIPQESNSFETAEATGVPIHPLEWPSDDVYDAWCHVMGIELIVPQELGPTLDKYVTDQGAFLQTRDVDITDFIVSPGE